MLLLRRVENDLGRGGAVSNRLLLRASSAVVDDELDRLRPLAAVSYPLLATADAPAAPPSVDDEALFFFLRRSPPGAERNVLTLPLALTPLRTLWPSSLPS